MDEKVISKSEFKRVISELILSKKCEVFGVSKKGMEYQSLQNGDEIEFNAKMPPIKASLKNLAFPRAEPLFYFKKKKSDVELIESQVPDQKRVILGLKPCDAAGFQILKKVFNWDYKDDLYNKRLENTIIISQLCDYRDAYCFCTSVGLSPVSTEGSDLFMVPLEKDQIALQIVTEKGRNFLESFGNALKPADSKLISSVKEATKGPEVYFDSKLTKEWLDTHFEHEYWESIGKTCLGCARCAFTCPTCHCFDIVDEEYQYNEGRRMKNWDACQFSQFTLHASGHNPRGNQENRSRQRVSHKFKYYPDRFGVILCTGCGRCSRGCPVGIDTGQILMDIFELNNKDGVVS